MEKKANEKTAPKVCLQNIFVEKSGSTFSFSESPIHKGDIFLVDFKTNTGCEQNGVRPALILQNDIGNNFSPTTIVCPLSSQRKMYDRTHVIVTPEECGITKKSIVLCEQIRAVDKSRLGRKVGHIFTPEKMEEIESKVKIVFGF